MKTAKLIVWSVYVFTFFIAGIGISTVEASTRIEYNWSPPPPKKFADVEIANTNDNCDPLAQFYKTTGETIKTRRAGRQDSKQIGRWSTDTIVFNINLANWNESERPLARLWVGFSGSKANQMTSDVGLKFLQNNTVLYQAPGYGTLACVHVQWDFDLKNGIPSLEIDSHSNAMEVNYEIVVIIYVPKKQDPAYFPKKPELLYPADGQEFRFPGAPLGGGIIQFRWENAKDNESVDVFEIEFLNKSDASSVPFNRWVEGKTQHEEGFGPGPTGLSIFQWKVRALDRDGRKSEWSDARTFVLKSP